MSSLLFGTPGTSGKDLSFLRSSILNFSASLSSSLCLISRRHLLPRIHSVFSRQIEILFYSFAVSDRGKQQICLYFSCFSFTKLLWKRVIPWGGNLAIAFKQCCSKSTIEARSAFEMCAPHIELNRFTRDAMFQNSRNQSKICHHLLSWDKKIFAFSGQSPRIVLIIAELSIRSSSFLQMSKYI